MYAQTLEDYIKVLLLALFSIGIVIPQHWDFGIQISMVTIYYEEIIVLFLIILVFCKFLIDLSFKKKYLYMLYFIVTILFFILVGIMYKNTLIVIFKDIRVLLELAIILISISYVKFNKYELNFLIYLVTFSISIYFLQYMYSFLFETYLMNLMDEGMSLGLKRINLGNHIAVVFMLPFIYYLNKKLFYYIFFIVAVISVLSVKRTDIGLLLLLSLLFVKKFNLKYLILLFGILILITSSIFVTSLGDRFFNLFDGSADTRLYGIINAFSEFIEKPLIGYGFGKEMIVTIQDIGGVDLSKNFIDNSYLTILVKMGAIGFILYIIFLLKITNSQFNKITLVYYFLIFGYAFFSAYLIIGSRILLYAIPFAFLCTKNINFGGIYENSILRKA